MKHVYGIPENTSPLNLKSTMQDELQQDAYNKPYRLWVVVLCCVFMDNGSLFIILNYSYNEDVTGYKMDDPNGLYGSIPFMIGHRKGLTCGSMWNNPSKTYVDVWREVSSTYIHIYISILGFYNVMCVLPCHHICFEWNCTLLIFTPLFLFVLPFLPRETDQVRWKRAGCVVPTSN